jgi:hypothetical protein
VTGVLGSLADRLPHRRVTDKVNSDLADSVRALSKSQALLLSGRAVRFRFGQSIVWSVVAGLLAAGFVAGLYDGILQVNWYIHIGSFYYHLFYLKAWWDGGMGIIHSTVWPLYRHIAFRDIPAPALATMAIQTLLAKRKWWGVRVSTLRVVTAPLVILVLTFAMGIGGVWLLYFGGPNAWHALFGSYVLPGTKWLGDASAGQLALGFVIGRILHRYWAPVGATLQGVQLDRVVGRWQGKIQAAQISMDEAVRLNNAGLHILPAWVRLPIAPPVIRERFSELWRNNRVVRIRGGHAAVIVVLGVFVVLVTLLGLVGHYYAGAGHSVPYLFPGA